MKLSEYRIEPGHYQAAGWTILWGGPGHWQLRDGDYMIDCYQTLRRALTLALRNPIQTIADE